MGNLDEWNAQLDAFRPTHRVLVYSRRYHPPNPALDDREVYSPALHAADLAALLQALDLAPAHVVGAAYGAYAALVLALDHPEMVRSLVLGEPPVLPLLTRTPAGDSLRRTFESTTLDPARAAFARRDSVAGLRRLLDGLSGTPGRFDRLPPPERAALLAHSFEVRRELLADPHAYLPTVACARMGRVAMPVLLLQGQRSPRMFHIITEELARCFRSDTLHTVPGAGYGFHVANPAYYNQIVLRYIATH
jgi:pimeloyl-ACP methyl ester carboxylesterase